MQGLRRLASLSEQSPFLLPIKHIALQQLEEEQAASYMLVSRRPDLTAYSWAQSLQPGAEPVQATEETLQVSSHRDRKQAPTLHLTCN
jgi:hypothetical protein